MIDPVGAALSVLMFDIVIAQNTTSVLNVATTVILSTIALGVILGSIGAVVLIFVIKQNWVPGFLQEGFTDDGEYVNKLEPTPSKKACRFCEFNQTEYCSAGVR